MIKIGLVSIDVSHPLGFAEEIEKYCMDMKYEFLCKESFRGDDEAEWFKNRFGISEIVKNIEDMADKCDIGFVQSCNWEKHLEQALPFIEKGKPVFIDKPIVGSVKDIKKLRELVKNGADIYGSSSARYCSEVQEFLALPEEQKGNIISIFGTCGVDDFNYGIHITEILSEIAGAKIVRSKFVGKTSTEIPCEIYNVEFENGTMGTYH
ncbi:MAG: Gfo/Idh/MocA family oxidoreductase, partial [Clostridia bacterium]|nr:Gfo/Idh/MocA family oxidoreductase [Clostridia bacterium]